MSQAHIHYTQKVDTENDTQFQIQLKRSSANNGNCQTQLHPLNALELHELLFEEDKLPEGTTTKINITNDGAFFHSALEALGDEDLKQPKRLEDAQSKYTFTQFISKGTFKQQPEAWGYRTMFTPVQNDFNTLGNAIQVVSSSLVNFDNFKYLWKNILQQLYLFQFISFENGNFLVLLDGFDEDFSKKFKVHLMNILEEEENKNIKHFDSSDYIAFMLFKTFTNTIQELLDQQLEEVNNLNWARTTASIFLLKLYSIDQLFALTYSKDPSSLENIIFEASKSHPYYKELATSFINPYKTKYQEYAEKDLELTKLFAYKVHPFDEKVGTFSTWFLLFIPLFFYFISLYDNISIVSDGNKTMVQIVWTLGLPLVRIVGQYFILKNILWGLSPALNKYVIHSPLILLLVGALGFTALAIPLQFIGLFKVLWVLQDGVHQRAVDWINELLASLQ
ncbi:hypothetical protein WICPIJ_004885 [Wickerhamomyces pijperi]|uniref:Uncharacterized protein n=1 Tax=Wickerhamomyces pijperi TaxID=599730 RepID=A0A9P8TMH5_WICPI|nr:hypothetical protein WICPIJ_004885 [Wickerhamomyces pijperi]